MLLSLPFDFWDVLQEHAKTMQSSNVNNFRQFISIYLLSLWIRPYNRLWIDFEKQLREVCWGDQRHWVATGWDAAPLSVSILQSS